MIKFYFCETEKKVGERCTESNINNNRRGKSFMTLEDCNKKCYTLEEENALNIIKNRINKDTYFNYMAPKFIASFDKINDIPILNYDGKLYTKKIFNYDEIKTLYIILQADIPGLKYKNVFVENLLKSKGGIIGKRFNVTILKEQLYDSGDEILYFKPRSKTYQFHFDDSKYSADFVEELRGFYNSSNVYLLKDIRIDIEGGDIGHRNFALIKKDENRSLQIFLFEPNNTVNNYDILKKIKEYLKDIITGLGYKHNIFNLSNFYGIQNLETSNGDLEEELESIKNDYFFHFSSVTLRFIKFLDLFEPYEFHLFKEEYGDNIFLNADLLKNEFMNIYFSKIFKEHLLYATINMFVENIAKDIVTNEASFFRNFDKDYLIDLFKKSVNFCDKTTTSKLDILYKEKFKLRNIRNNKYNFDFFRGNCYLWSYYTVILIIMNPKINPFEIIKASYFQTNNIVNMNEIFKEIKNDHQYQKETEGSTKIFRNDYLEMVEKENEELKRKIVNDENNTNFVDDNNRVEKIFLDVTRILYIKITNLIILNIIYNRLQNKYLLFSIQEGCTGLLCIKKIVPEKVNELLNKFTISNIPLTNDNIISTVLEGRPIENINHLILLDKDPLTNDFEEDVYNYYQANPDYTMNKYLKYKSKYLNLKKLISIKKKLLSNK